MTVTNAARQAALEVVEEEPEPAPSGPVSIGDLVRVRPWKTTGRLLRIAPERGEAEVEVGGKRMRVAIDSLIPLGASTPARKSSQSSTVAASKPAESAPVTASAEIVLVGRRVDEALPEVERAVNEALLAGKGALRIVHGHGTGRLAAAVREYLAGHPGVASHRPGEAREGGTAVTIAVLDV